MPTWMRKIMIKLCQCVNSCSGAANKRFCDNCLKSRIKESARKNYYKYQQDRLAYHKTYREENKDKIIKNKVVYNREKRNNPFYNLRHVVSNAVYIALARHKSTKDGHSVLKYLDYTIKELKEHLEKLFEPWMNWDNWGKYNNKTWNDEDESTWTWQIDHIIPQSTLPYISMEDENFKKCWALENLRPYSAKLNNKDSNRRNHEMHVV